MRKGAQTTAPVGSRLRVLMDCKRINGYFGTSIGPAELETWSEVDVREAVEAVTILEDTTGMAQPGLQQPGLLQPETNTNG